jgi:hypothetical protein
MSLHETHHGKVISGICQSMYAGSWPDVMRWLECRLVMAAAAIAAGKSVAMDEPLGPTDRALKRVISVTRMR